MQAEEKYLVGAQAAEFLGVKPATLYAYASRGQIESIPGNSGRERCYKLSDLIKLRQSARGVKTARDPAKDQAIWTGPSIKSAITEITSVGHRYRGKSALELAATDIFEEVAERLWHFEGLSHEYTSGAELWLEGETLNATADEGNGLDRLKLLLVRQDMRQHGPREYINNLEPDEILSRARTLIKSMSTVVGPTPVAYAGSVAMTLVDALKADQSEGDIAASANLIDFALVLCADHELNASALACRVAASCDASLYSCLLAALGTFSGAMHGGASYRTAGMVSQSLEYDSARQWLESYLATRENVPGFGSELYQAGDPRARLLIERASTLGTHSRELERLLEIIELANQDLMLFPNLDVGLTAVSYALDLPPEAGSLIFAVSRTAGWVAHAVEQRLYGGAIRPRAKYIGLK